MLLPLTFAPGYADEAGGRSKLELLTREALLQADAFEVVTVSGEQLKRWTGRSGWQSEEKLPADLFARLLEETGGDGVIFVHLTGYSPYPPMGIGWRMRLVTVADRNTIWAADVWHRAVRPERSISSIWPSERRDAADWKAGNSPDSLARNSLAKLLATLPRPMGVSAKVSGESADKTHRVGANQPKPRLPAKEKKYGNQSEPTHGAASADIRSGSVQEPAEAGD
ncbi:MAG: hypothetical protein ACO1QS_09360 [Verrucomicrobiota bacterium]